MLKMTKKKTLLMLCAFVFGTAVFSSCNNGGDAKEAPKDSVTAPKMEQKPVVPDSGKKDTTGISKPAVTPP